MLSAFARGIWQFVVGDDWRTAAGIALSLAVTALIAALDISAWWLMPFAAIALLRWSLLRAGRVLASTGDRKIPYVTDRS